MDEPPKSPIPLDYSCPAQEDRRDQPVEEDISEAARDYNESTFGVRRPFSLWPIVAIAVIAIPIAAFLPRWAARWGTGLGMAIFFAWRWFRER